MRWVILIVIAGLLGWYLQDEIKSLVTWNSATKSPLEIETEPPVSKARSVSDAAEDIDDITELLNRRLYAEFFQTYEQAFYNSEKSLTSHFKQVFLRHIEDLERSSQYHIAERLLQQFVENYSDEVEVRLKLATVYRKQQKLDSEINALYAARAQAFEVEQLDRITARIRTAVKARTHQLLKQDNTHRLLALYQMVTSIEPEYSPYFLQLAEIQVSMSDYDGAIQSLNTVIYDPMVGEKAVNLQQTVEKLNARSNATVIPLQRMGDHYAVKALIDDVQWVNLMLDTGATLTILSPKVLLNMGINPAYAEELRHFNTAAGVVEAPLIRIKTLALGNKSVAQLDVAVLELSGRSDIDGLLGMNFLKHFRFFINQSDSVLLLSEPSDSIFNP